MICDKNGESLNVGDKVEHPYYGVCVVTYVSEDQSYITAEGHFGGFGYKQENIQEESVIKVKPSARGSGGGPL